MRGLLKSLTTGNRNALVPVTVSTPATVSLESVLETAAAEGASDVHFEPKESGLLIRFRTDGQMRDYTTIALPQRDALLARGKMMGGMDITERRLPQDGRASLQVSDQRFHLRMSTLPTVHGENLVVRLLDQSMPAQSFGDFQTHKPPR